MLYVATRRTVFAVIAVAATAVALYSLRYFTAAHDRSPDILANAYARPFLYFHIAGATTALLVGVMGQAAISARFRSLHRWLGRVYVVGCLLGGAGGLVVAFGSTAGPVATAGFGTLSVLWIVTGALGWRLALKRRFADHRRWMLRSYALTFAAVTLRVGLPVAPALGFAFVDGYRALSFLSWLINLAVVEGYLAWERRPVAAATADRATPDGRLLA